MLNLLFTLGARLLFKGSPFSITRSRGLVYKDRDVNFISLVLSFIPFILPFYMIIEIFLIVDRDRASIGLREGAIAPHFFKDRSKTLQILNISLTDL